MYIYRGPLLLGFDPRFNTFDTRPLPLATAALPKYTKADCDSWLQPLSVYAFDCVDGSKVTLCDCGSLGVTGRPFTTWLDTDFAGAPAPFTQANPTRTVWLEPATRTEDVVSS